MAGPGSNQTQTLLLMRTRTVGRMIMMEIKMSVRETTIWITRVMRMVMGKNSKVRVQVIPNLHCERCRPQLLI